MSIIKTKSGLLYSEDFSERSLLWTLSPGNRLEQLDFGNDGLTMHRSKDYMSYTMKEPERDYTCIIELDHVPSKEDEIAGIIIFSTPEDYAECQSLLYKRKSELINGRVSDAMVKLAIYEIMENRYVPYTVNDEEEDISELIYSLAHSQVNVESAEYQILKAIVANYIKHKHFAMFGEEYTGGSWSEDFDDSYIDVDFYKYVKFNKVGHSYTFYASMDRENWITLGTTSFQYLNDIGFFIYGRDETEGPIIVEDEEIGEHELVDPDFDHDEVKALFKSFSITDNNYIRFENISQSYNVEVTDLLDNHVYFDSGMEKFMYVVSRKNKVLQVNTNTIGIPMKDCAIRIYKTDDYENTIAQQTFDSIMPGDVFTLDYDIRLFVGDTEVTSDEVFNLGEFQKIIDFIEFRIHNFSDIDAENITVSVSQYSEYYGGWREVMIAMYDEDIPMSSLEYHKSLLIPLLPGTTGKRMYMKLSENPIQSPFKASEEYRFRITVI